MFIYRIMSRFPTIFGIAAWILIMIAAMRIIAAQR
jgi:hypothetical protein